MSGNSLVDLAVKLKVSGISSGEYIKTYMECTTTLTDKIFKIPVSEDAVDDVLRRIDTIDWVSQRGSDSKMDQVEKTLEVLNPGKKKYKPNRSKTFAGIRIRRYAQDISKKSKLSIISLINRQLKLQVIKHMYYPRLVNRTGTFASSVKVLDVQESDKGYLTLTYTWQRSPYSVFSKYYGKEPWKTPNRDPDDLSVLAISELAKKYYTDRIYYRRKW